MFGNTSDFNRDEHAVGYEDMFQIDRWAMQQLQKLIAGVRENYESFTFHRVFGLLYNFCTVEMSSIYMDVLKDKLYCNDTDSISRRSSQTALYHILQALIRMLAPIIPHTAEEAWGLLEHKSEDVESVHVAHLPEVDESIDWRAEEDKWNLIMGLRDEVLRVLEGLRQDKTIASNQEASVTVYSGDEKLREAVDNLGLDTFAALCIVSEVRLAEAGGGETRVEASKSPHQKCQRCWNYWESVGSDSGYPDLCTRCAEVVRNAESV
jgi:isoleucyl-tRNA synthetase